MRIPFFGAASTVLAGSLAALPAWPQTADSGVMYRCPGNDYSNTISAAEAEKLRCKKVENAAVTIMRAARPSAPAAPASGIAATGSGAIAGVDSAALRARASNVRRTLERNLKAEESKLAVLENEFNGGEPERRDDEFDFQKYLDRAATMRSAIARKQLDIAAIRREIQKLPPVQ